MLKELIIQNFAIIQELSIPFSPGLTTFTGETGAGKSIVLDALEALTGGRIDNAMIRSGADKAYLEAIFQIPEHSREALLKILEEEGLLEDNDQEVVLCREIRSEGRNIARVNGRAVSTTILRSIGTFLVDIHGQSEHLSLLKVKEHIHLLDRYCGNEDILQEYQSVYRHWQQINRELTQLRQAEVDAARKQDLLNYQIQEIEAAALVVGEDEELQSELNRLANAEKLAGLCQRASTLMDSGEVESASVLEQMGEISQSLHRIAEIDKDVQELAEQSDNATALLEEIALSLNTYIQSVEYNPQRLTEVENRIALISSLKRKYGASIQDILTFSEKASKELEMITNAEERIAELEVLEEKALVDVAEKAVALSQNRKEFAAKLGEKIEAQLDDLRMAGAKFKADIQHIPDEHGLIIENENPVRFDESGIDTVEFLIAPNPGEGLKPLVKIASGGETSRLMLALKNVLAEADTIPTLVFDEIDQGIGGRIGAIVGEKLWQLGGAHQVLCVTHLPQLAAYGVQHYHVRKLVEDGRTLTLVDIIDGEERVTELATMFGGATEANREAALEALWSAKQQISRFSENKA